MKKYLFIAFWAFYAIPFPMILYYNSEREFDINTLNDKNPQLILGILLLSIFFWLLVLSGYFQKWILQIFATKKNIEKINRDGISREAEITNTLNISKSKSEFNTYEIELLFKNLANTEIKHKTIITDYKPHEHSFESGKKVNIILNKDPQLLPPFIIAATYASFNYLQLILRISIWIILTITVIGYYFYSYQIESQGRGWIFISLGHPLITCPSVLLFYRYILRFVITKFTGLNSDFTLIKFKGIKTPARLIKVSQTGIYINEQPMMRFELQYTDNKHDIHIKSLKKVIGLLDLDMTKVKEIEIFYLPENPHQIAFASDLQNIE